MRSRGLSLEVTSRDLSCMTKGLSKHFTRMKHVFGIVMMIVLEVDVHNPPRTVSLVSNGSENARDTVTVVQLFGKVLGFFSKLRVNVLLFIRDSLLKLLDLGLESFEVTDVVL